MADAIELATAYVSLIPSMQGAQGAIMKDLLPGAESAADAAGQAAGGKFSGGFSKLVAAGAITAGVVAGFKGLYEVGSIFDDVSDTIRVGTGATGDALDGLTDSAVKIGKTVPASFESVGSTVADVNTRMGLSGETLETVASQYLEAGRILGQEVDISRTSAAFSAFKIEGEGVSGAMDTLFQVSQATGVGMNELADAVQKNAPAMQTLGFSFEETAALAGSLDKAGLNSTAMMSSMSKGMITLAKDGEEPAAAFQRVTGEIQGFVDSGDKAAALDLASEVFGTKGAAQFVGALESGAVALDDLVAGTGATSDTILAVGSETQDFAEKWQIVKNNAAAAMEPLGSAVFTALGGALSGMLPHLESFGGWLGENTWVLGAVAAVIGTGLVIAFAMWTASIWAATAALLANPVTWIIVGIVALVAAIVALAANWDAVVAWVSVVWGGFINWLREIGDGFVVWWNGLWAGVGEFISSKWSEFTGWVSGVWSGFVGMLQGAGEAFSAWWSGMWAAVGAWISSVWSGFVAGVSAAWSGFVGFIQAGLSAFSGFWSSIWSGVSSFISGVWSGIVSVATNSWNGLVSFVTGIPGRFLSGLAALGGLAGRMLGWVGSAASAAMGKFGELVGNVGSIPGRILGALGDVGSMLYSAGSDIVRGLMNGISSLAGTIGNFFLDLLPGWIVGPFKAALGINSPSRVFAGFGENIGEGVLVGVGGMQADIDKTMAGLVTVPDLPAMTVGSGAGGLPGWVRAGVSAGFTVPESSAAGRSGRGVTINNYNPVAEPTSRTVEKSAAVLSLAGVF